MDDPNRCHTKFITIDLCRMASRKTSKMLIDFSVNIVNQKNAAAVQIFKVKEGEGKSCEVSNHLPLYRSISRLL